MSDIQLPEAQPQWSHTTGPDMRAEWAVALKVPNSGNAELDAMIRQSLRRQFAGQAMEGFLVSDTLGEQAGENPKLCAAWSVELADSLLSALDQQPQQSGDVGELVEELEGLIEICNEVWNNEVVERGISRATFDKWAGSLGLVRAALAAYRKAHP